jgi:hypothetical protein
MRVLRTKSTVRIGGEGRSRRSPTFYARIGRMREALLALVAAFELQSDGTWREAWTEQGVLLRVLRDLGMADESIRVIERLRKALANVSNADIYGSRLDTLELHAQLHRRLSGSKDAWPIARLLEAATANAEAVLAAGDEVLPCAVLLRQLLDRAEADGIQVPNAPFELLKRLVSHLAGPYQTLVAAAGRLPDPAVVASVAGSIQVARYNDDVGYDLRLARMMAHRLARASIEAADLEGLFRSLTP